MATMIRPSSRVRERSGLEIIEQVPDVDAVIVPVGGGGLLAGVALAVKTLRPQTKIIAVEADHVASFSAALQAIGSMPASVAAAIRRFGPGSPIGPRADRLGPGDRHPQGPFAGGTTSTTSPWSPRASSDGRLVGWVANRAHHADVGGAAPGSMPADADRDPRGGPADPARAADRRGAGGARCANSRTPDERRGDLDAQVGANAASASSGWPTLAGEPLDEVAGLRRAAHARRARRPARRHVALHRRARLASAAGPSSRRRPRSPLAVTDRGRRDHASTSPAPTRSGRQRQRGRGGDGERGRRSPCGRRIDPTIPANGGALRPVAVDRPAGTIVAARPPAAVGAGNVEVSQRVADVCLGALAQALPDRVGGGVAGDDEQRAHRRTATRWVYYETVGRRAGRPARTGRRA